MRGVWPRLGDAFMLRKRGQEIEHLWVLVTRALPEIGEAIKNGEAIMVNITTQREHSDTTTVLNAGDHPFIDRPSVVFYADARPVVPADLDRAVMGGAARTHRAFETTVLARIQAGMEQSPMTPRKMQEAYRAAVAAGLV